MASQYPELVGGYWSQGFDPEHVSSEAPLPLTQEEVAERLTSATQAALAANQHQDTEARQQAQSTIRQLQASYPEHFDAIMQRLEDRHN